MRIRFVTVGKPRDEPAARLHDRYAGRIEKFGVRYESAFVPDVAPGGKLRDDEVRQREAERLLAAVRTPPLRHARSAWNPFERVSGELASVLGIPIALAALAMSRFNLRTNGVVSMHHMAKAVPLTTACRVREEMVEMSRYM